MKLTPYLIVALLIGLGLGLAYSWFISPVTYVDANPSILHSDFKDQYRVVIAASYGSTHDLPRARARLELLGDIDPTGELSAQAQRMLAAGQPFDIVQPLAQLATDLQQGSVSLPATSTPFVAVVNTTTLEAQPATDVAPIEITETAQPGITPTASFKQTPLAPQQVSTSTARPTFTAVPQPGAPFALIDQETVCDANLPSGLLQVLLIDSRRKQVPGVKVIVNWAEGEDRFFTGLKPELGNGYADFIMQAGTIYNVRVEESGAFVSDLFVPTCQNENGEDYLGGLLLTFQQP